MAKLVDFFLERDNDGVYDLVIEDGQFKMVDTFDTMLQLIIFGERRADESEVIIPHRRRGWVGNTYLTEEGHQNGSKLWLLAQARRTTDTLNAAIDYMQNATAYLVEDGLVHQVNVRGEFVGLFGIRLFIDLLLLNNQTESFIFDIWLNTGFRDSISFIARTQGVLVLEDGSRLVLETGGAILL